MSEKQNFSRRDFIQLMGGSSAAVAAGNLFPKASENPLARPELYSDTSAPGVPGYVKEVEEPTYTKDVVGEIERFDERARAFSKARYVDGDGFYEKFYEMYPDLKGESEALAPYRDPAPVRAERGGVSLTGYLLANMAFSPIGVLSSDEICEPGVSPNKLTSEADASDMAHRVKEFSKALGAYDVKIGPLKEEYIYSHRGARVFEGSDWGEPIDLNHPTAISIAYAQDFERMNNNTGGAHNVEVGKIYTQMATLAISLANAIAGMGYSARAHHVGLYEILQVPVAIDAGLGELSRAGYCLHPELGLNYRLVTVTTDMPLAYDKPVDFGIQDFCENCLICAENCPPGAISTGEKKERNGVMVWDLDEVACLAFWGENGTGCSTCHTACPWSKRSGDWLHDLSRYYAASGGGAGNLMAALDRTFYGDYESTPTPDWLK
ncbi:MAG: 4Fe-4S dicluster domain-containing protein [Anaerolineales bacterium]